MMDCPVHVLVFVSQYRCFCCPLFFLLTLFFLGHNHNNAPRIRSRLPSLRKPFNRLSIPPILNSQTFHRQQYHLTLLFPLPRLKSRLRISSLSPPPRRTRLRR